MKGDAALQNGAVESAFPKLQYEIAILHLGKVVTKACVREAATGKNSAQGCAD